MDVEAVAFKYKLKRLLSYVEYPDFDFVIVTKGNQHFIQIECEGTCNVTHKPYKWKGRKWYISPHSTDSEIVQTCFKAVMTAVEHEAREKFLFCAQPVYRPHLDVYELWDISKKNKIDIRDNADE